MALRDPMSDSLTLSLSATNGPTTHPCGLHIWKCKCGAMPTTHICPHCSPHTLPPNIFLFLLCLGADGLPLPAVAPASHPLQLVSPAQLCARHTSVCRPEQAKPANSHRQGAESWMGGCMAMPVAPVVLILVFSFTWLVFSSSSLAALLLDVVGGMLL